MLRRSRKPSDRGPTAPGSGEPDRDTVVVGTRVPADMVRLPAEFRALLELRDRLVDDLEAGRLSRAQLQAHLDRLVLEHRGAEWTVGLRTRQWFRRTPGGSWEPAIPPQG